MTISIVYKGKVQAQQRPRNRVVRTKDGRVFAQTYEAQESRDFKSYFHLTAQSQMAEKGLKTITGPCRLSVLVYMPIPSSFSQKKRKQALTGEILPAKKPDVDNILKAVMDALNGVAYADDRLVVRAFVRKAYDETEAVVAIVETEYDEEGMPK